MKKYVKKQENGSFSKSKILTSCVTSAALIAVTAVSVSAAGLGHSGSKVRFTVYENKEATAVVQFGQLGKSKDVFAAAQIAPDKLDPGDYYFEAEQVFDSKMSKAFENAMGKSKYAIIADYAIVDIAFTDTEDNQVYPDADIYLTSSEWLGFNLVYKYDGSSFTLVDHDYKGQALKIKDVNKERLILATMYYINDSGKISIVEDGKGDHTYESSDEDIIWEEASGNYIDYEGSIIKPITDKTTTRDNSVDKDDFEKAIKDIEKITPDNDSVATGDMTGAAAIAFVSCAAVSAVVLAAAKTKKKNK